jgi:pre-rRNA-processing protein TSR4
MASPPKREQDKDDEDDPDSDDEEASELEHRYHPEAVVPPCPRCGGERVFEMQLVPGLISVLKPESLTTEGIKKKKKSKKVKQDQSAEERQKEIAAMLAGKSGEASEEGLEVSEAGMEWGTVMVFGCKKDCVGFGEEWVGVEWEEAS